MGDTDPIMDKFNASISYDQRMWDADIRGSKAYVKALEKAGLVTTDEMNSILNGMDQVSIRICISVVFSFQKGCKPSVISLFGHSALVPTVHYSI